MQIFSFFGGLGLVLYGLALLSRGLRALAGGQQAALFGNRAAERRRTRMPHSALLPALWGAAITALLQSSGAVALAAMGAADAGLMAVPQAIAVCWGANLGTTATAQLVRLGSAGGSAFLCPAACFVGAAAALLGKGRLRHGGESIFGLGLVFSGVAGMQAALAPLLAGAAAAGLLAALQSPPAAFAVGAVLTAAMQSSSASVALVQAAAAGGALDLGTAATLVLGCNLGACSTALLAGLGFDAKNPAAKQVAAGNLVFNLVGSAAAAALLALTRSFPLWAQRADAGSVANLHTGFNAATLVLMLGIAAVGHSSVRFRPYSPNSSVDR